MTARNATVDRLRGLSILAVFIMHFSAFCGLNLSFAGHGLANGYYGVVAFFAISGYLITTKLLANGDFDRLSALPGFYRFRLGRIGPNLCLLILVLSAMNLSGVAGFSMQNGISLPSIIASVLTLRFNVLFQHGGASIWAWAPLWSLMIEEVFYIIFPILLLVSRKNIVTFLLMIALCVFGPFYRQRGISSYYEYAGCFDNMAWGVMAAICARHFASSLSRATALAMFFTGAAALAALYTCADCHVWICLGPTGVAAATALILFSSATPPFRASSLRTDPLMALGALSYEVYLLHITVILLAVDLNWMTRVSHWIAFSVVGAATVAVSHLVKSSYADPVNDIIRGRRHSFVVRSALPLRTS